MTNTTVGKDGKHRCTWCTATDQYLHYHDNEWGYPVNDDHKLFEKICLEGFQAGLSWRTILEKRENFRKAFKQFDYTKVARFNEGHVEKLLQNEGIVRHRGKIEATINNAKCAKLLVKEEGSLAAFFWRYEPKPSKNFKVVSTSPESTALSKTLKKLGWKFVGPTTVYSFMQAMGMVNDHAKNCFYRAEVEKARKKFIRPTR